MSGQNENEVVPEEKTESAKPGLMVVGVGASAGGLEALERMFQATPNDTGMAFVIVQHLSPDFKSLMDELLARHTRMNIHRVEHGMQVEPNSLYLLPPNQEMIISDGRLLLTEKEPKPSLSLPIDHFFRSLAADVGDRSVAVVLSGTGSDGSRGLKDVHEAGGMVVVQSPDTAKFDGMPKSAIDTGLVDIVATPEEIPDVLSRFSTHAERNSPRRAPVDESSLEQIFRLLQERHQIDFSHYKLTTIGRRIERRIQINREEDIESYVERLNDPAELDQLYKDLLIGVTSFFRDGDAFHTLRHDVLPELIKSRDPDAEFRIWVAACGTGEEAYSIGILVDETLRELDLDLNYKIFATDVHRASLDVAHTGIYPASSLADVDEQRKNRYFTECSQGYQVHPDIRQRIVFAPHNLIKDTPFTRLDLVTCRNLLIYLRTAAQRKVISLFHFGLKTGGVLFMGASESPGELADEFEPLHERWKVYRKRRDSRRIMDMRSNFGIASNLFKASSGLPQSSSDRSSKEMDTLQSSLLNRFMPPSILVNGRMEVVQLYAGAGKYLSHQDGKLSSSLLEMIDGDIRLALSGAIQRVIRSGEAVCYDRLRVGNAAGQHEVRLEISQVDGRAANPKYLITFTELDTPDKDGEARGKEVLELDEVSKAHLQDLEEELQHTKENLQATIEELETSNEELQATNEELVASNEELQSTNEELHSVNEELYTVNAEYQKKISELTQLTSDMDNLMVSTEVHTLFLDSDLRVRKFTPKMAEVFNLVDHDIGRRIEAFSHNISCVDLGGILRRVLETGERYEERCLHNQGSHFLLRVIPYVKSDDMEGVVVTLIDISSLVAAQAEIAEQQERFERAIAANRDGTWDWPDVSVETMWWSDNCYTLLGYEAGEFPPTYSEWLERMHPDDRERVQETTVPSQEKCFVELHLDFEYRMRHKTGEYTWFRHRAIVDHDEKGRPMRITGSVGDIHDRKVAEARRTDEIRRRDNFLAMLSHELRNPMGAVLNALETKQRRDRLENGKKNDGQVDGVDHVDTEILQVVDRQTRHMARLLDDLLDISRLGQGKIQFRKEVFDLNKLADDVVEAIHHRFQSKNQKLHVTTGDQPILLFGDPDRIKQAQVNLLANATKYTPQGGEVWYKITREKKKAVITIRDTGSGIPPELLRTIFDLFVQADDSISRASGGMGVGLSLARGIIKAHGGDITATSDGPDQGSTFEIRLPTTEQKMKEKPKMPRVTSEGKKLLLVEDNADARKMLVRAMQMEGFEIAEAGDGESALNVFMEFQPDIAVVDIGLPVMDGYEFARQIRQKFPDTTALLVALTGYGRESDRRKAREAGFDAHLVKPLVPAELYTVISTWQLKQANSQGNGNGNG